MNLCTTITTNIFLSVYFDVVEQISKSAKDGSEVRLLLMANILISLVALGIQGFLLYKAWRARNSTSYEVKIEAKKCVPLDENSNRLDLESLETIAMTPEVDPSYVSLQQEIPDLGFGQDTPGVDEVKFLKKMLQFVKSSLF